MPPTVDQLDQAFKTYFAEMKKCVTGSCYWALLHLIVVMPDICSALEHPKGDTTGESGSRYREWCERYWSSAAISPATRWDIRCALLHQGRTLLKTGETFSYIRPAPPGSKAHEYVNTDEGNVTLEVDKLAVEIEKTIGVWFQDLQRAENAHRLSNVAQNLAWLAREKPKTFPSGAKMPGGRLDTGNISSTGEDPKP